MLFYHSLLSVSRFPLGWREPLNSEPIAQESPIALARQAGRDRSCVHTTYSVSA
jgi:hypothetical protein